MRSAIARKAEVRETYARLRREGTVWLPMDVEYIVQCSIAAGVRKLAKADGLRLVQSRGEVQTAYFNRHRRTMTLQLTADDGTGLIVRPDLELAE